MATEPAIRESGPPPPAPRRREARRRRHAEFLPELEAITEQEHSPLLRVLIFVIAALLAVAIYWSATAMVDQTAVAPGTVRPAGTVKIINHPDGGTISRLYVREGERVVLGDPLLAFDGTLIDQEISRLVGEVEARQAEILRLEAELSAGAPRFPKALRDARPELVAEQTRLFRERQRALESRRATADQRIIEARATVAELEQRIARLKEGLAILEEQEGAVGELAGKGYFPKLRHLSLQRQLSEARSEVEKAQSALARARSELARARQARDQVDSASASEALAQLAEARIEHQRARSRLAQLRARRHDLVVTAPADGVVKDLAVSGPGESVRPNAPIMKLVPLQDSIIVEAQVSNSDIGFVSIGQPATVKILTYDFTKYGALEGEVVDIAPDATRDPRTGALYFTIRVKTKGSTLGAPPDEKTVQPGMQAEVDLAVGKRSILSYLTDRLQSTARNAFRER